jgi:hypothetical protein
MVYQGSYSQAQVGKSGAESQLGQVTVGARKVDQLYRFLAELRGESPRDSRGEIGETERSDVKSYKGVRRIRKGEAEESSKGDGGVSECERSIVSSHGVLQGGISNFTTREVERGNLGDKGGSRSTTSGGFDFSNKAAGSGGETTNSTDKKSDRSVRCISNGVGLCNRGVRGKRLVGKREKEWPTNKGELLGFWRGLLTLEKEVRGKMLKWVGTTRRSEYPFGRETCKERKREVDWGNDKEADRQKGGLEMYKMGTSMGGPLNWRVLVKRSSPLNKMDITTCKVGTGIPLSFKLWNKVCGSKKAKETHEKICGKRQRWNQPGDQSQLDLSNVWM